MASRHNGMLDDRQRNGSGGRFAGNSRFPKKRMAVDHKLQRQRNRETLLESKDMMSEGLRRRMNKYGTGGKQQSQIQSDRKRKEMERILKGKTLIPHLGANWGSNKNTAGKGGGGMQIVFEPKAVSLDPPGTGSNQRKQSKVARKRSFNDMMRSGSVDDKENVNPGDFPPIKRARISSAMDTDKVDSGKMNKSSESAPEADDESKVEVTSVAVTVYCCKYRKCSLKDKVTESLNVFCKGHSGNVTTSSGRKYFWKCSTCDLQMQTLNTKRVTRKCQCAGLASKWLPSSVPDPVADKKSKEGVVVRGNEMLTG